MMIAKSTLPRHVLNAMQLIAGVAACLMLLMASARSDTIYKYVAPDGSVTYSDTPPAETEEYEEMNLPEYPAVDPEAHRKILEQMAATSSRLQEERLKREQARQQAKPSPPVVIYQPREEARDYRRPYWYYRDRPRHDGPRPPYRLDRDQPQGSKERLKERLTSPINIPSFGGGE